MKNNKVFEENNYKWSYEETKETPYYYDMEFKGRIWCDYQLFRLLRSQDEKEYKKRDIESRCVCINKHGLSTKCRLKCSIECPYGENHSRMGCPVSMDAIQQNNNHIDFVDESADPRNFYDLREIENNIDEVLANLSSKARLMYILIKFYGETERSVGRRFNMSQPAIHKIIEKINKTIEEKLKNNFLVIKT